MTETEVVEVERHITSVWWIFLEHQGSPGCWCRCWCWGSIRRRRRRSATCRLRAHRRPASTSSSRSPFAEGWKWVHGVLGVLFVVTGIMALMSPFQTFGDLRPARSVGTSSSRASSRHRPQHPRPRTSWSCGDSRLAAGIGEMVIGVWAIGYPGRSAWLLVLWVGLGALMRGITEIVLAFQLRGARPRDRLSTSHDPSLTRARTTPMTKAPDHHRHPRRCRSSHVRHGCSQKYSAERDGKKLGEAICDLRDADSAGGRRSARRHQRATRRPRQQVRVLHGRRPGRHSEQPGRPRRARHPGPAQARPAGPDGARAQRRQHRRRRQRDRGSAGPASSKASPTVRRANAASGTLARFTCSRGP